MPIVKIAALIINEGKILLTRENGKEIWLLPAGKTKPGEDNIECLKRELAAEMGVEIASSEFYSTFRDISEATGEPLTLHCYFTNITGKPKASNGLEEVRWVGRSDFLDSKIRVARSLQKQVLPALIIEGHM